ncbi:HAMP domain-containing sensor histidine kinase [Pandoraea sp.]|nr:HAMP domain-containing sensor histidine kinase [Pandoraea sp.]TAL52741.1 MAG: HAMP domain-containing histidine kinase [Pandoraea sp.]TAM17746.1 MAG: HAMP domain-containing histidine kinase [Pandoraea sp.]
MKTTSLRARITTGLLLYAAVLSAALIAAGTFLNARHERLVWMSLLGDVMVRDLRAAHLPAGGVNPPKVRLIDLDSPAAASLPADVRRLGPGLYDDFDPENLPYAVLVKDVQGHRMAALIDISTERAQERRLAYLLDAVIVAGLALLMVATWWLAGRLLRPVSCLVDSVHALDPSRREQRLVPGYRLAETKALETAFNAYLQRLDGFVLREREFIDTASHELRTPISVISGAAQVLGAEPLTVDGRRALQRIRLTTEAMRDTLAALLHLAKEPSSLAALTPLALESWLPDLIADYWPLLDGRPLTLEVGPIEPAAVRVTSAIAAMIFGNLLRNAIEHTQAGHLEVSLRDGVFSIDSHGETLDAAAVARLYRSLALAEVGRVHGAGLGLYLVRQLCERLGWVLRYAHNEAGELQVRLDLHLRNEGGPEPTTN